MKPPHGNKSGGPGRPPSDRGSFRGAGASQRPRGSRPDGQGFAQGAKGGGQATPKAASPPASDPATLRAPRLVQQPAQRQGGFQQRPERVRPPRAQDGPPRHGPDAPRGAVWLYGVHAVAAALTNPARRLRRLVVTEEAEATLLGKVKQPWPVAAERADRGRLDHLLGRDIVHQGVALLADPLAPPSLQSVLERTGPLIVLDQVTDPRNVGAILRSAAAFGAAAVITQDRNAPEENGALAKAASGALEAMPLLRAVNITRTLIALKAANIWCVGLDASGPALSGPSFANRRVALVLGAEGEGMRRLTRETCDEVAGLPIKGGVDSLNVSAAAAVALYELGKQA